jgi:hypothetical protein
MLEDDRFLFSGRAIVELRLRNFKDQYSILLQCSIERWFTLLVLLISYSLLDPASDTILVRLSIKFSGS